MAAVSLTALPGDQAHGQVFRGQVKVVRVTGSNLDTFNASGTEVHAVAVATILQGTTGGSSGYNVEASLNHATKVVLFGSEAAADPFTVDLLLFCGGRS